MIHVKKIHQKEITTLIPEIDMEGSQTKVIKFMKKFPKFDKITLDQ